MLQRRNTRSGSDLLRRKSTVSVKSVQLKHLDAATAQRDAQSAANLAFKLARAKNHRSVEASLFPPLATTSANRHCASQNGNDEDDSVTLNNMNGGHQRLHRQQSVRFVGTCDERAPRRYLQAYTMPSQTLHSLEHNDHHNTERGKCLDETFSQDTTPRQPLGGTLSLPSTVQEGHVHALLAEDEYYTPEDDVASVPSSYRRLRRSKSMFTRSNPLGNTKYMFDAPRTGTHIHKLTSSRALAVESNKENVHPGPAPVLRAPTSMSFLDPRRKGTASITSRDNSGNTHYLGNCQQDTQLQLLGHKPAVHHSFKSGRTEIRLRRSLRGSSLDCDTLSTTTMQDLKIPEEEGLKTRARKVSKTLKTRLRNLFSLPKTESKMTLPEQHINSVRSHGFHHTESLSSSGYEEATQPPGVGFLMDRSRCVPSAGPCAYSEQTNESSYAKQGSTEDFAAVHRRIPSDEKSRVTSWTDSGASTLTSQQRQTWAEWERRQQSVVQGSDAQPLPHLAWRPGLKTHEAQSQGSPTTQLFSAAPKINSQRIYSALMKRLHENDQPVQNVTSDGNFTGEHNSIRGSSTTLTDSQVTPTGYAYHDSTDTKSTANRDRDAAIAGTVRALDETGGVSRLEESYTSRLETPGQYTHLEPPVKFVPPSEKPGMSGTPISDRRSAFFGSPNSHLFRTASPYRRLLRQSMAEAEKATTLREYRVLGSSSSDTGTQIHRPFADDQDESAYSESAYSCDAGDDRASTNQLSMPLPDYDLRDTPSIIGDASISLDPPVTYRQTGHRVVSSVSSVNWKTLLSAQVAKLESSPSPSGRSEVRFTPRHVPAPLGRAHVRERTRIEGYEKDMEGKEDVFTTRREAPRVFPLTVVEPNLVKWTPSRRSSKAVLPPVAAANTSKENDDPSSTIEAYEVADAGKFQLTHASGNRTPKSSPSVQPKQRTPTSPWKGALNPLTGDPGLQQSEAKHTPPFVRIRIRNRQSGVDSRTGSPIAIASSTARLQRHRGWVSGRSPGLAESAVSSPGLTAAVERQFGGLAPPSPGEVSMGRGGNKENEVIRVGGKENDDADRSDGGCCGDNNRGLRESEEDLRPMGGRRMVDLFLSSRRRRVAGSEDSGAFV